MLPRHRQAPEKKRNSPRPPPPCRGVLVIISGSGRGSEFGLKPDRTIVGRGPGADFAFEDCAMTSAHAEFEQRKGAFIVRNLGKGPLSLNGTPIREAELKTGDVLEIGEHSFRFLTIGNAHPRHDG